MRRRNFSESCSVLQSIVPNLLPKATQDQIVRGTIEYIRELEQDLRALEKLKQSVREKLEANSVLSNITNGRSSVDVTVSGGVAFFGIEVDLRQSLVVDILKVFDKYGVEILVANVVVDEHRQKLMVTVTANVGGCEEGKEVIEMIKTEILFV
ncbi:BHLH domain-containing protein [Heracleum sosnowskyi]|uniref:BHLH domain-containing protein n=1 Tax=Heracleum sosnowskyi TaxID=360622 RepID=A0AAD8I824_9APIA|nr:BHLH domain-containing protein [Heracleum sosnowskyi]